MTRISRILAVLAAALVLTLVALAVALESIDLRPHVQSLSEAVERQTGRRLEIAGGVDLDLLPRPRLRVGAIRFQNFASGTRPYMFSAERLEVTVALLPLLTGMLDVSEVVVIRPDLLLETDDAGRPNWQFGRAQRDADAAVNASDPLPVIRRVRVRDARLRYRNGQSGAEQALTIAALQFSSNGLDRAMQLELDAAYRRRALAVGVELDSLASLLDARETRFSATLNGQKLEGDVVLQLAEARPALRGAIRFGTLDLGAMLPASKSVPRQGRRLFSASPLPLADLGEMDAELTLAGNRLHVAGQTIDAVRLHGLLKDGRLHVDDVQGRVAGGALQGNLTLALRGVQPALTLQLDAADVRLGEVLAAAGRPGLVEGMPTALQVRLRGSGTSIADWMGSLAGTLQLDAGPGSVRNRKLDLAGGDLLAQLFGSLIPGVKKEEETQLRCAVAHLEFRKGVAAYDRRVALETEKMNVISSGEIDLGAETMDIGFVPQPRRDAPGIGIGAGDLVSVARLRGPLVQPELGLDTVNTAKAGLKVYGAVATAGVSLLVGSLIEQKLADPAPCRTARTGPPKEPEKETTVDRVKRGFRNLLDF